MSHLVTLNEVIIPYSIISVTLTFIFESGLTFWAKSKL